jgi:mediator of RNA polymerase II transcription subunit 5
VRAEIIVRLTRRVNSLLALPAHVANLDVSNIMQDINLDAAAQEQMNLDGSGGGSGGDGGVGNGDGTDGGRASNENIEQILNDAVAANGTGLGLGLDDGTGMDTSLEDMFDAANMGNPELLTDLDMEGMF